MNPPEMCSQFGCLLSTRFRGGRFQATNSRAWQERPCGTQRYGRGFNQNIAQRASSTW